MNAEIIGIGSELLLGQIVNTDAQFISQQLSALGINVFYHTVVGDNHDRILDALRIAEGRSDLIITTGGLGPTMDDLSKETVAEFLEMTMVLDTTSMDRIKHFFKTADRPMTDNNIKQAMFPPDAIILPNNRGTAPGAILKKNEHTYIILPGPPYELQPMFVDYVVPYLEEISHNKIISKVVRIYGMGESAVEEKIKDLLMEQTNPTIAPLASYNEVTLRVTAKAATDYEAVALIEPVTNELHHRLGRVVYGYDQDSLESVVVGLFKKRALTLSIAESCTGGQVSHLITNIPGASEVLLESCITYSNDAKISRLGVPGNIIEQYGAVSEQTATKMALEIRNTSGSDIGLAITGIAGPGGGSTEKPVGLVYIALSKLNSVEVRRYHLYGDRLRIKHETANLALDWLRCILIDIEEK